MKKLVLFIIVKAFVSADKRVEAVEKQSRMGGYGCVGCAIPVQRKESRPGPESWRTAAAAGGSSWPGSQAGTHGWAPQAEGCCWAGPGGHCWADWAGSGSTARGRGWYSETPSHTLLQWAITTAATSYVSYQYVHSIYGYQQCAYTTDSRAPHAPKSTHHLTRACSLTGTSNYILEDMPSDPNP